MENNYSLADIASVANNDNAFGGNGAWILILLFAMIFGFNGAGYGRGDYGQFATAASQQEILFGQQFQGLDNKIDRIGNGIADATFALNNTIVNGANNVAGTVIAEGRATADKLCEIKTAIHAEGEATRAMIQQNKIESLQAQVNELKTQNMFCGIPRINPYGYQVVPNQNGCGCNCGNI
ncbi:MAG: hypothetical protein MJ116_05690 [Lachnospiraceae bacterium]|nr:hypothetical protein [Lachnospiraceae bacterium]